MRTVTEVITGCIDCNICVKECSFLARHGTPGSICARHVNKGVNDSPIFACNLCGLCNSVCPKHLDVTTAFLDVRRSIQQVDQFTPAKVSRDTRHNRICTYEKTGASTLFSLHHLPEGCDTVFFPGCTLTATRSVITQRTYSHLQRLYPNCGIILACCGKPSHDLGLEGSFQPLFSQLTHRLRSGGVKKIITACPSCHVTFRNYFPEGITRTVYEELAENPPHLSGDWNGTVTIHDTCTTRDVPELHEAVRTLITTTGASITEGKHNRDKSLCCGEGAAASFIAPEVTDTWKAIRKKEAGSNRVITYCAGCSSTLGKTLHTTHLLDLLFDHERALKGNEQKTRSPFTYFRRLHLKWQISRNYASQTAHPPRRTTSSDRLVRWGILILLMATIAGLQLSGIADLFSADGIRELYARLQDCHPLIFIAAFSLGMVLLLPASPFVIIAGLIYGPLWGLIYAILGATIGAALAFLVSRYLSADCIRRRFIGSRWRDLQDSVDKHGWKIVAFSRLIPLFPFTLVNYAFGMTRVKFSHYVITTGICMIPACLAFVLFSSSLADISTGHISSNFVIGLVLIGVFAAIPVMYKHLKKRG